MCENTKEKFSLVQHLLGLGNHINFQKKLESFAKFILIKCLFETFLQTDRGILILKIRKSKSVGGSIDSWCWGDQWSMQRRSTLLILGGGSTIDVEAIDAQCKTNWQSVQRWSTLLILGGADQWSTWRGSTVNFHFCCEKMLASVDRGDWRPPRHFVRSTGWPLVFFCKINSLTRPVDRGTKVVY